MAPYLHHHGTQTAGMNPDEIRRAYAELRDRLDRQGEEAERQRRDELEAARRKLQAEAQRQQQDRRRLRIERLRSELAARGEKVDVLDDDQVLARVGELQAATRQETEAARQRAQAESLFRAADCPLRHTLHLDQLEPADCPEWHRVRDLLDRRGGSGYLAALIGNRGTGKTQLATSLIHRACQRGRSCRYLKRGDLSRIIRRTYTPVGKGQAAESESDVLDDLVAVDGLLVIDEVHQVANSDFDINVIVSLIDRRYDAMRDTLLIGNLSKQEFAALSGDSIVSRIHECGDAIECRWPSFRKPGMWNDQQGAA